ncbi:MAG: hypothetical protein Q4B93_05420 [Clostridia bacterium]|nr:hypothetical protein [Clostridia bacterium]
MIKEIYQSEINTLSSVSKTQQFRIEKKVNPKNRESFDDFYRNIIREFKRLDKASRITDIAESSSHIKYACNHKLKDFSIENADLIPKSNPQINLNYELIHNEKLKIRRILQKNIKSGIWYAEDIVAIRDAAERIETSCKKIVRDK